LLDLARIFDRWRPLLLGAVVVLYVAAGSLKSRLYEHRVSALIGFGCRTQSGCYAEFNRASLPHAAIVFRSGGYDGQFFYYLGRELFGGPPAVLDSAPFRRARIGLPLLAAPLLAMGDVGRVYGLPLTLLALHLLSVWWLARARPSEPLRVVVFALNPFSLLSFMLCTADGAALSIAVVGALTFDSSGRGRWVGALLLAFALLTKETFVVVPFALGGAALFDAQSAPIARIRRIALCAVTLVPMLVWWRRVGFSLGLAATHGGLPFSGFVQYLPNVDLTRGLLALVLVVALALGAFFALSPASRVSGFVLLATAALISTATAEEYWATIANIARLFTPMAAAPALLGARTSVEAAPLWTWTRRVGLAWMLGVLALTAVVLLREATRRPLPFYVVVS
jgi:hypothetical protein